MCEREEGGLGEKKRGRRRRKGDGKDGKDGSEDVLPHKGQQMGELWGGVRLQRHCEGACLCFFFADAVNTVRDGS